ncbi:MAG: hypothetical protein LBQ12_16020 [Deltaproteobacteria bacterium]|jgi:hypothetical protein|nr:hypothetical protein [Deltaproteobacteria bacterium]
MPEINVTHVLLAVLALAAKGPVRPETLKVPVLELMGLDAEPLPARVKPVEYRASGLQGLIDFACEDLVLSGLLSLNPSGARSIAPLGSKSLPVALARMGPELAERFPGFMGLPRKGAADDGRGPAPHPRAAIPAPLRTDAGPQALNPVLEPSPLWAEPPSRPGPYAARGASRRTLLPNRNSASGLPAAHLRGEDALRAEAHAKAAEAARGEYANRARATAARKAARARDEAYRVDALASEAEAMRDDVALRAEAAMREEYAWLEGGGMPGGAGAASGGAPVAGGKPGGAETGGGGGSGLKDADKRARREAEEEKKYEGAVASGERAASAGVEAVAPAERAASAGAEAVASGERAASAGVEAVASGARAASAGVEAVASGERAASAGAEAEMYRGTAMLDEGLPEDARPEEAMLDEGLTEDARLEEALLEDAILEEAMAVAAEDLLWEWA